MAANLNSMFSTRVEWHKSPLCKVVQGAKNSQEALQLSGMNWDVGLHPYTSVDGIPMGEPDINAPWGFRPSRYMIVREDTRAVLGECSTEYYPVQNRDNFKLLDQLVGKGEAVYETAGAIGKGERVFICATTGTIEPVKGDVIKRYIMVTNSHDGTSAYRVGLVDQRIVCENTLEMALNELGTGGFTHKHTRNVLHRVNDIAKALGIVKKHQEELEESYHAMLHTNPTMEEVDNVIAKLLPLKKEEVDAQGKSPVPEWRKKVKELYTDGKNNTMEGVAGTAYGLYNSITEFNQFYKQPNLAEENRWKSATYGAIADANREAYSQVLQLVR